MNKIILFLILILSLSFFITIVSANDGEVCNYQDPPANPGPQGPGNRYDVVLNNHIAISSAQTGFQLTGCGAAVFSSATVRTAPMCILGSALIQPRPQADILNSFIRAGALSPTHGGTFDEYMAELISLLNQDPLNCYDITIKRINSYTDPPVITLPAPQISYHGLNVRQILYRPYNFRVSDIADAIRRVSPIQGGIGIGGVKYNSTNDDVGAHLFNPLAIESAGHILTGNTNREHDFKIYDPYFGIEVDRSIVVRSSDNRMFSNLFLDENGYSQWYHLEELFFVENLGLCANLVNWTVNNTGNGSSSSSGPVTPLEPEPVYTPTRTTPARLPPPITPISCGFRNPAPANTCTITMACPANMYCSYDKLCTCKSEVCGDKIKDPSEECDDGNLNSNDGCSATCKLEQQCNGVWKPASQVECTNIGQVCLRISHGSFAKGVCTNDCKCNMPAQVVEPRIE